MSTQKIPHLELCSQGRGQEQLPPQIGHQISFRTSPALASLPVKWVARLVSDGILRSEVAQSSATLCDPMGCSLPGFSIHGIFQARILEWVAISFSRGSSQPRNRTLCFLHCRQTLYPLSHQGMRVKEESEKASLKLSVKKTKIMASGPITSWQIEGEKVETVTDFLFLGSKITVDGDCSHEIRRQLLLGRKAMTNLDSVLKKQRHHFADKGPHSQGYDRSSSHVWM